jgi:uncharacterized membrane protein YidH (DUF202 family)
MHFSSNIKIIVGWVGAGLFLPIAFLYFANPLAGLALFTILFGALLILIGPIAHIVLARRAIHAGEYRPLRVVAIVVAGICLLAFIVASFGFFNFA